MVEATIRLNFDLDGVGDLGRDMLRYGPALSRAMWQGARDAADVLQQEWEQEFADSPGGHRWTQTPLRSPSGGTVYLNTTDDIPGYRELGTPQYRIHPKARANGRLIFFWQRENRMFIGRPGQSVNHPMRPPHPFVERRAASVAPRTEAAFVEQVDRVFGRDARIQ